jgi:hypothetical protein
LLFFGLILTIFLVGMVSTARKLPPTLCCSSQPDAGYRFLVFSRNTGQSFYQATVVEHSDDHGASNYFIRRVSIGKFFDEESKRKFQVQATDGIVMTDSAENEYGADVYFWSNGSYRHEPIDD